MATDKPVDNAEQLRQALSQVEQLQSKVDGMRSALERLVQPLADSRRKTTAQITEETRLNASQAVKDVQELKNAWNLPQTKELLAQAKNSASTNTDMTAATTVPTWGWATSG